MNNGKKELVGSKTRDAFKWAHKHFTHNEFYGCDIDFVLVDSNKVIAILDYKTPYDFADFESKKDEWMAEKIFFKEAPWPIYLVVGAHPKKGPFTIYRYNPENEHTFPIATCATWGEYSKWEESIRKPPLVETGKFDITKFWADR